MDEVVAMRYTTIVGIFTVMLTLLPGLVFADDSQIQPIPKPVEATTVKSSKSNSSE